MTPGQIPCVYAPHGEDSALAGALRQGGWLVRQTQRGPDGQSGLWLTPPGAPPVLPTEQTHHTASPLGETLVYAPRDTSLLPAVFVRPVQTPGHLVTLRGGRWLVPVARDSGSRSTLPRVYRRASSGDIVADRVHPQHADLYALASAAWGALLGGAEPETDFDDAQGFCLAAAALRTNYLLSDDLILALGLLDTESVLEICRAVLDLPLVAAVTAAAHGDHLAGKASPSVGSALGPTDGCNAIAPPSANSSPTPT